MVNKLPISKISKPSKNNDQQRPNIYDSEKAQPIPKNHDQQTPKELTAKNYDHETP